MLYTTPSMYVLSRVIRNHSSASPSLPIANTPYNMSHLYMVRSLLDNTWGMAVPIPTSITGGNRVAYWWHNTLSTQQKLVSLLLAKGAIGKVQLAYLSTGGLYVPETYTPFTSSAIAGNLYVHILKANSTSAFIHITNHLGHLWDPVTNDFASGLPLNNVNSFPFMPVVSDASAVISTAVPTTGTNWFPPLSSSTGIDTTATTASIDLDVVTVTTAASIKANVTNKLTANTLHELPYKAYVTADTHELIFPLPCRPQLNYPPDFNSINFLPVFFGNTTPSIGSLVPYMVKIKPYNTTDEAIIDAIGAAGTLSVVYNNDKHATQLAPASITHPTLVVDITTLNYIGFYSESTLEYYGLPAYLFMPSAPTYPSITSRMIKLPYTYTKLTDAIVLSPPAFEDSFKYFGGASQAGNVTAGNYVLPVKMQYGWSIVQLGFDFTGGPVNSYRLTFTPSSVIDPTILRGTNPPMSLKVGVFAVHPYDLRTKYRAPGYAPDMREDDPAEFFYIEVSSIHDFVEVVAHTHTPTITPGIGQRTKLPNLSGKTIDWAGTTQVDLIVEKSSGGVTGTLSVYIGRTLAASFTVPWIENGHVAYFGTNRNSHLAASPAMFTLISPSETINVTEPANGLLVPPPPTLHEYIEVTTETTSSTINPNPYVVYYHNKGSTADLYIPHLSGSTPYKPTRFAVIRNIPFTSGSIYEKIVNQKWNGSTFLRSFMIDTTDAVQFPPTTNLQGIGILYSHNASNSGNYQVVMRTGTNWSTNLGTFTAEPVDIPITYLINPYNVSNDLLSPLNSITTIYPERVGVFKDEVTLTGSSGTGEGCAISLAFASASTEAWTFSFRRVSVGTYLTNAYFDLIISPSKKEHIFDYNPTNNTLAILPLPHKQAIRIRFPQDSDSLPLVQLSNNEDYAFDAPVALSNTSTFGTFDGSALLSVGLEKVGGSTVLYLYEGNKRIAMTALPFEFIRSGSFILAHGNGGNSTETLRNFSIMSGLRWANVIDADPLRFAPVITRSVTGTVVSNQTSVVYQLDADFRHAYVDCTIHNMADVQAVVSVYIGLDVPSTIAKNVTIPPRKTLSLYGNYMAAADVLTVHATTNCNVRVGIIGELKYV